MTTTPYGLRVVGHRAERRRLVDWRAAFVAYAGCDPRAELDREAFVSHFHFPADPFRSHFEAERSERGYSGPCATDWLFWDIDRPDDLPNALSDSRRLVGAVLDRYPELDDDALLVFLSGHKGAHVGVPCSLLGSPAPCSTFNETARRFALAHAERAGIVVDGTIYSKTRLFRAPNSRHPKSGLFKCRLSVEELMHLTPEAVVERARQPEPFDLPEPTTASPQAVADWQEASRVVKNRAVERRVYAGRDRFSGFARRFLREGELDPAGREVTVFRVAAELSELYHTHDFDALVLALLEEPALDAGLSPSEVKHAVGTGVAHARRKSEGGAA
jgi:hypothetical protein